MLKGQRLELALLSQVAVSLGGSHGGTRRTGKMTPVVTRDIRQFVSRDWDRARRAKDEYWATRIAAAGAAEGLRVADELRRQAILLDPNWPRGEDRRQDLLAHVRLSRRLRRANTAGRR